MCVNPLTPQPCVDMRARVTATIFPYSKPATAEEGCFPPNCATQVHTNTRTRTAGRAPHWHVHHIIYTTAKRPPCPATPNPTDPQAPPRRNTPTCSWVRPDRGVHGWEGGLDMSRAPGSNNGGAAPTHRPQSAPACHAALPSISCGGGRQPSSSLGPWVDGR
jgi:hypothetical protein